MIERKKYFIFLGVFGLILFLGLVLVKIGDFNFVSAEGTLSCSVTTDCSSGTVIFRMKNTTNSHAGTPTGSSYPNLVCCSGVTGLGNDCNAANKSVVLRLSGANNAHVRQNTLGDYAGANNACISAPAGDTISVAYRSGSCAGDEATFGSMSGATNAHVGTTYTTKICAKITAAVVYSVSVDPTSVNYGGMAMNTTRASAIITATVGDAATKLNIIGADATYTEGGKCGDGVCTWALSIALGQDQYVHAFTKSTGLTTGGTLGSNPSSEWVALTKTNQLLSASVTANGSQNFKLDMRTPSTAGTETNLGSQYSTDVTIVASAP